MHFSHHRYSAKSAGSEIPLPQKPLSRFMCFWLMFDLVLAGFLAVLLGFGMVLVSMLTQAKKEESEVKGGGVIMIGPVPIIFGSDMKWASVAIALAVVLIVLTVALSLV